MTTLLRNKLYYTMANGETLELVDYSAYEAVRSNNKELLDQRFDLMDKIARLELALQKCKEQRDQAHLQFWDDVCPDWVFEQDNAELDAILE